MKKRKLKGYVLPTLYLVVTLGIFAGVVLLGSNLLLGDVDYNYGIRALKDTTTSVGLEDTATSSNIVSPVDLEKVTIGVHYYSKDAEEALQQNSLIYYENTYLPNTGTLYVSDTEFEVKAVFDGKVSDIIDDEFFGKCLVIEHNSNLRTYYYGLDNIDTQVGDEVTAGTVLGTSKNNAIMNDKKTFLLEAYYNNELINPENFIGTKISDYN